MRGLNLRQARRRVWLRAACSRVTRALLCLGCKIAYMRGMSETENRPTRVNVLLSAAESHALDDSRRRQPDIPNRSEAIRRLMAAGLNYNSNSGQKMGRPFERVLNY